MSETQIVEYNDKGLIINKIIKNGDFIMKVNYG